MFSRTAVAVLIAVAVGGCSTEDPREELVDDPVETSQQALLACQSPYGGTARAIPGTIEAEHYDVGGEGCAYHDTTAGNSGNVLRADGVDLQAASEGGHNVGWVAAGEWLRYTVNVTTAGSYRLELRTATTASGKTVDVSMESTVIANDLPVTNTGNYQSYATITVPQVTLAAGAQSLQVLFNQSSVNLNWIRFTFLGCTPETDPGFCSRLAKNCGPVTAPDNCGASRTVDCGTCTAPSTCSATNVCQAPIPGCLRTLPVPNSAALDGAVAAAEPGDCLLLADGNYSFPTITKQGTEAAPITIRAANRGRAVVNSGVIHLLDSAWVVLEGLDVTSNGAANGFFNAGSEGMLVAFTDSHHCQLTRSRLRPAGAVVDRDWIVLTGGQTHHNRIDHNDLGPQNVRANMLVVDGTGQEEPLIPGQVAQHNRIDHNYFHDITNTGGNNWEAMRIGRSWQAPTAGFNVVEYNFLKGASGDPETISVKSSDNVVRHNTMRATGGEITLRHGNRNQVYGNYIIADGHSGSRGIRVYGADHRIFNNYVAAAVSGIHLDDGSATATDEPGKEHYRVYRTWVYHNIVVGKDIRVGGSKPYVPLDCRVANNIITGSGRLNPDGTSIVNEGNLVGGTNPLTLQGGVYRLLANTAGARAIGKAVNNTFYNLATDIQGQPRSAPDVGADEQSTATIAIPGPLTTVEVGPDSP